MFDPEWDDDLYAVYAVDPTRGIGRGGVVIILQEYAGTGADDPRCRIARGGDCCARTTGHELPHIACSMGLVGKGLHIIDRVVPR